jgi:hypothetical protein
MPQGMLVRVASYRRSSEGKKQATLSHSLKRMLRIRQSIGLGFSIAWSISPLRAAAYISSDQFS